jgi:hypothetical protein
MMPGSMMMIHEAFTYAAGNSAELAKTAQTLDEVSANLASIYARAAGGTAEDWRAAMREETWYSAEQAVAAGLADRTGDGAAVLPAEMDLAAFADQIPGRIAAQLGALPRATAPAAQEPAEVKANEQETSAAASVLTISVEGALDEGLVERLRAAVRAPEPPVDVAAPAAEETDVPEGVAGDGEGDKGVISNHAEDLPGWLTTDSAPIPAWLNPAEEAMK